MSQYCDFPIAGHLLGGLDFEQVEKLVSEGKLPAHRHHGGPPMIAQADIEQYLHKSQHGAKK